jgi:hypothetical protein
MSIITNPSSINLVTDGVANKINLHNQLPIGVETSKFKVEAGDYTSQLKLQDDHWWERMDRGGIEISDLNLNFVSTLAKMIETGRPEYSLYWDITTSLQYSKEDGKRSIWDMARKFEEHSASLENNTGISQEQREFMQRLLEQGLAEAINRNFQASNADNKEVGRNLQSLKQVTQNAVSNILASGLNDKTKSVMLDGIDTAVSQMQSMILRRAYNDAALSHKHQTGGMTRSALELLVARINEANKQTRDDIKSIIDSSRNQLRKWQPSITMPDFGDSDEADILDIVDSDDTGEEEPSDDSSDYELVDYQD